MQSNRDVDRVSRRSISGITNRVATLNLPDALVSDHMVERSQQRADSVGTMLRSTASVLILGIAVIVTHDIVGVSVVPIVASC